MNDNQEYFVFGSNMAGRHGKGAALYAAKKHSAETGIGEGITGSSYALPTKGYKLENLDFKKIDAAICRFLGVAKSMPEARFILTPIGTGLAGHSKKDVWRVLKREGLTQNIYLSATWVNE